VKHLSTGPARCFRLKAVVAYPAVSLALVVSVALALTPFGPSSVMALTASAVPTESATPTTSPTTAPTTTAPTATAPTTADTSDPDAVPAPVPGPVPLLTPAPGAGPVDQDVLAWIESPQLPAQYLPADAPALGASPFQTFRVRFQMHNAGTAAITATPQLEYRPEGAADFVVVPDKPVKDVPVHVDREWVPSTGLSGGTMQGPLGENIAVSDFRLAKEDGLAMTGHHSMGANPDQPVTLPPASYTEEEFTVSLSIDAQYLTGYELRITDAGAVLTGTAVATIRVGGPPATVLSRGQHQGVAVAGAKQTTTPANATGVVYPLLPATSVSAVPAVYSPGSQPYPLIASTLSAADTQDGIHGPYSMTTDRCAVCHSGHQAQAPSLLIKSSQSALCLTCHGSAALGGAPAAYSDPAVPANDAATRSYYSHDGVGTSSTSPKTTSHTQAQLDEFSVSATGGTPNRHSECADCHNPHQAQGTPAADSTLTATGAAWGASGSLAGVSGVSVANNAAGAAPTYTFLNGVDNLVTSEYQLCFKCHSGFTTLTSNVGLKPTQYALDKGVEFNPANASFHPVEAQGTNQSVKMAASLAGTSPYKLWNFTTTSTIRCLSCHATSTIPGPTPTATLPAPGSALPPHTSVNRGILLRNYQDRVLKTAGAAYSSGDFALCYVCHAEEPFANASYPASANATNFPFHGLHVSALMPYGAGTDINTPGSGGGNAICAECHFRIHSTTNAVGTQSINGSRLVNFAPNVQPLNLYGTISPIAWTPEGAPGTGSCTLTCHGYQHNALKY
jgi:predicted CXXCH cytochrome family protein